MPSCKDNKSRTSSVVPASTSSSPPVRNRRSYMLHLINFLIKQPFRFLICASVSFPVLLMTQIIVAESCKLRPTSNQEEEEEARCGSRRARATLVSGGSSPSAAAHLAGTRGSRTTALFAETTPGN